MINELSINAVDIEILLEMIELTDKLLIFVSDNWVKPFTDNVDEIIAFEPIDTDFFIIALSLILILEDNVELPDILNVFDNVEGPFTDKIPESIKEEVDMLEEVKTVEFILELTLKLPLINVLLPIDTVDDNVEEL